MEHDMLIRITNKANEKIKLGKLANIEIDGKPKFFEEWYINTLMINRKTYLILTEGVSLFSIIKYAKGINTKAKFESLILETIKELFNDLAPGIKLEDIPIGNIEYSKAINGSILKNQSDQIYHAKRYAEEGINTFEINRIPLKAIEFQFPVEVFIAEMGKILLSKGYTWTPDSLRN
jgi:hypothetical protein